MILRKIIISVICFVCCSNSIYAQKSEVPDFADDVLGFVMKLNSQLDSFFIKEKAEKANRLLGYFDEDLRAYLITRRTLLDSLRNSSFVKSDGVKILVNDLRNKISKISGRITDFLPILSSELGSDTQETVNDINGQVVVQEYYLSDLFFFLEHIQDVDKKYRKKIINEGEDIQKKLTKALKIADSMISKLQKKFNLKT